MHIPIIGNILFKEKLTIYCAGMDTSDSIGHTDDILPGSSSTASPSQQGTSRTGSVSSYLSAVLPTPGTPLTSISQQIRKIKNAAAAPGYWDSTPRAEQPAMDRCCRQTRQKALTSVQNGAFPRTVRQEGQHIYLF